jgi:glycosyltransferase involved in cell wall biosynthesis
MEGFSYFGLNDRLIVLRNQNYIKAKLCYVGSNKIPNWVIPLFPRLFRAFMVKHAALDLSKPNEYGFIWRSKGGRSVANAADVMKNVGKKFPLIQWKVLGRGGMIAENARVFNVLRMIFSTHGAGLANIIFMQPKTVVCEIFSDRAGWNFVGISQNMGLFHVVSRLPTMLHLSFVPNVLPVYLVLDMIKAALSCLASVDELLSKVSQVER